MSRHKSTRRVTTFIITLNTMLPSWVISHNQVLNIQVMYKHVWTSPDLVQGCIRIKAIILLLGTPTIYPVWSPQAQPTSFQILSRDTSYCSDQYYHSACKYILFSDQQHKIQELEGRGKPLVKGFHITCCHPRNRSSSARVHICIIALNNNS